MPGRTFQSGTGSYRYSINGQEKTPEIAPNTTTALYWEYDSRIGRRWNTDPRPNTSLSSYNCFGSNPISYKDYFGDTLSIRASSVESRDDLSSIVDPSNVGFINFPKPGDVDVTLNKSITVNGEEVSLQKAMIRDKGLRLLYNAINNSKNFFYSPTLRRQYQTIDLTTGATNNHDMDLSVDPNFVKGNVVTEKTPSTSNPNGGLAYYETFENLSFTLRGDEASNLGNIQQVPNKTFLFAGLKYTRKYDGVIRVAPGDFLQTISTGQGTIINHTRSKVVFHELSENLYRVMGASYQDAHKQAIADFSNGGFLRPGNKNSEADELNSGANKTAKGNDTYSIIIN